MDLINDQWRSYVECCMNPLSGEIQIRETRRAFFAGAAAVIDIVTRIGEPDILEAQGVQTLEDLHAEMDAFRARIGRDF